MAVECRFTRLRRPRGERRAAARTAGCGQVRPAAAPAGPRLQSGGGRPGGDRARAGAPPLRWPGCWRCAGSASCGCRTRRQFAGARGRARPRARVCRHRLGTRSACRCRRGSALASRAGAVALPWTAPAAGSRSSPERSHERSPGRRGQRPLGRRQGVGAAGAGGPGLRRGRQSAARHARDVVARADQQLAIGLDTRTRGFDAELVLEAVMRLEGEPGVRAELVYAWADETTSAAPLHGDAAAPPAGAAGPRGRRDQSEEAATAPLREGADLFIDTSELPLAALRGARSTGPVRRSSGASRPGRPLISFAYPAGLPREADMVFDARFLAESALRPHIAARTGLDPEVGAFMEARSGLRAFL